MDTVFEGIGELIQDHWLKVLTAAFCMGVGWFFGRRRERSEWQRKEFFGRLNISLNMIEENELVIRTLYEGTCTDIFQNNAAVKRVTTAAKLTTAEDPLLPLPEDEYWHYLNAVLNALSEKFAEGHFKREMDLPRYCKEYLICLTCENVGEMRTRKVRAMVIEKTKLLSLSEHQPKLDRQVHITRWETLQTMAKQYASSPGKFLEMEICL